jgi:uncharacterized membrane protein YhhN
MVILAFVVSARGDNIYTKMVVFVLLLSAPGDIIYTTTRRLIFVLSALMIIFRNINLVE